MCIFPFRKRFRKSLKPSNKKDELKQIEVIFPHSMMCNFICDKLKKLLICKILLKRISYIINQSVEQFIHEKYLSLEDVDDEQINFAAKL